MSEPPPGPPQAQFERLDGDNVLENTRETVRSSTAWLARGVDSWFGDKPFEQGGKVSDGRLSLGVSRRAGEKPDTRLRFDARIRLPNVEEHTYLFIGRDNDEKVVVDTPEALSREERLRAERPDESSFFAGFGLALREVVDLRIGFHGVKPYAQARYRQPWTLGARDLAEFRQTFFLKINDRFGSTTALSYEHTVSSSLAVRWLSAATITQRTKKFDWSSILGGYKTYSGLRLLSLEAVVTGSQVTGVAVSDYGVQTKWVQPVYRDWLLGEVVVGYFWPRLDAASERVGTWAFGGVLTMRF